MIWGLAAAVVEHDWLSQQASNEDGGRGCKKKREIRRGEDVDHIDVSQPLDQCRPVGELRHDGAYEFDIRESRKYRRQRVDRDEFCIDLRISVPRLQKPVRLDRLPAKNAQCRSNYRDLQPGRHLPLSCASVTPPQTLVLPAPHLVVAAVLTSSAGYSASRTWVMRNPQAALHNLSNPAPPLPERRPSKYREEFPPHLGATSLAEMAGVGRRVVLPFP